MDSVRSTNMFEALNQPSKSSKDSTEKAPAKSAEKKAKKAEAAKAQPVAVAKAAPVRTGNKRGGFANKGTRPGSAKPGNTDNRGKRVYDRQSELGFQKNHGGARKGGLNQGGNTDLKQEAVAATEEHNAGAKDATETKAEDAKVEVKEPEVPDLRKTLAQHEAEIAARAVAGDVLVARAPVVGKEFKTGAAPKKNKHEKESLFSEVKADAEAKKAAESAKDAKPAKKAGKESKTKAAVAATPAPKPQKIVLDQFNDTVKPPQKREDAKPAAAAASTEAPKGQSAPRGGRGGARGGRGGARGGRGGRAAPDLSAFPPLGAKA